MRTIKNICLLMFLFGAFMMQSCKKDLSSLDTNKIDGIVLDTVGNGILNVFQFERLIINPKITTTLKDENLTYLWKINLKPNDTISTVLSKTKNLNAEIKLRPNDFEKYYQLWYEVTDKTTGLKYITNWKVNVKNSLGEGLVIAETAADGISSDLSLLMSPLVTPNVTTESIVRGLYSGINRQNIPGIVKDMRYTKIFGVNTMFAITDNSFVKINTLDYTLAGTNEDLFYGHVGSFKPESLYGIGQGDIYIEKGKLTFTYLGATRKFGLPLDFNFFVPKKIALNRINYVSLVVNFYDEANGYFVYLPSFNFGDKNMYRHPISTGAFNPNSLPNKTNLAALFDNNMDILHLLKDKTTGNVGLYIFDGTMPAGLPKALIDLSAAPNIGTATQFVIMDNQKVLYYATDTKIYAVIFSGATPVFEERYTVPVGEKITTLNIYQQADYPYSASYLPSNDNQLILSTYNTEGKLYILPLKNLGLGNIDVPNIKTYGGFRKITAVATQK